ncbi:unnamed protein product [Agarophyton chilense]|eukprot:gb/GEZJ01003118.1/.p1 GENE.gb/GEZJ01003118.1/~~gb/GEZJ01003118.1/.p1  ORF type:complete len:778 (+),score=93.74 gb/GEZJ01003118.1/:592-2925(+)
MGSRLKLRICTWNVGNAHPPSDLKKWLGVDEENDIVVVGAQEANLKQEKTQSPTSVLNTETHSQREGHEPATLARQGSQSLPSIPTRGRRFNKIAKAIKVAKTTIRDGSAKKTRFKAHSVDCEDSYWGKYIVPLDPNGDMRAKGIPCSSSSLPLRQPPSLRGELDISKGLSEDVPSLTFSQLAEPVDFENLDESLLRKSRTSSKHSEVDIYSGIDGESYYMCSEDSYSEGSSSSEGESFLEGEITTMAFHDLMGSKANSSKPSGKLRKQVTSIFGLEDDGAQIGEKKFSRVVEKNMPSTYKLVAKHHLMEIKLLIFVHKKHESRVEKITEMAEATGIGNRLPNKGAVAVKLTIDDTMFFFISSHLAAHEGAKYLVQRHEDVVEIMKKIEKRIGHRVPLIHQVNHVFWLGDLNYRLDLAHLLPEALTWSHERKVAYVLRKIAERQFVDLSLFDELRREMEEGKVFGGFSEGKVRFAPTFKVVRGKGGGIYQASRVPGYCDRILWHSLSTHRNHIRLRAYDAVPEIDTSDHKPVYATFDVAIPMRVEFVPFPVVNTALRCTVDFLHMHVEGLYEKATEMEESGNEYEVLEDGALAVSPQVKSTSCTTIAKSGGGGHTRRVVTASFHGNGTFIKRKPYRMEVPLRQGKRVALQKELPTIALRPLSNLSQLNYKYMTIAFSRHGGKCGSSCVIPLRRMFETMGGRHRHTLELELLKHCSVNGKVRVVLELVPTMGGWVDSNNRPTMVKLKNQTVAVDTLATPRARAPEAKRRTATLTPTNN